MCAKLVLHANIMLIHMQNLILKYVIAFFDDYIFQAGGVTPDIHSCSNLRGLDQGDTRWETAALAPASASVEPASLSHTHCDTCIRMDKSSQRRRREETRYVATATHSIRLP